MRPLVLAALLTALSAGAYAALTWRPPLAGPAQVTAAGGVAAPSAGLPSSIPAGPIVRTQFATDHYPVEGETEAEILRSLLERGPRSGGDVFFGLTAAQADLRYQTETSAAGCALANVSVDLDVTVTLPRWRRPPGASPALRRDWDLFLAALSRHEDEHRRIAVENAEALRDAVAGLRRPTCAAVTEVARRRVVRHQTEAAAAHRRFDAETGHGRTEGAVWPRPGD